MPEGIEWLELLFSMQNGLICKLKKSHYGLKKAPRLWYKHIDAFLRTLEFLPTDFNSNIYISYTGNMIIRSTSMIF